MLALSRRRGPCVMTAQKINCDGAGCGWLFGRCPCPSDAITLGCASLRLTTVCRRSKTTDVAAYAQEWQWLSCCEYGWWSGGCHLDSRTRQLMNSMIALIKMIVSVGMFAAGEGCSWVEVFFELTGGALGLPGEWAPWRRTRSWMALSLISCPIEMTVATFSLIDDAASLSTVSCYDLESIRRAKEFIIKVLSMHHYLLKLRPHAGH